jgi:hypothetical protein
VIKAKKSSSESVTFRLNSAVLNKLSGRAELQKTSLNVLVNQILSNYIEWEMDAQKAGWVPTQRQVLMKLIDALEGETVLDIAEKTAEAIGKDIILYMYGKYNLESLLSNIRASAQRSGFSIKEYDESRNLEILIQHDLGWKWSLFFKHYYQKILHDLQQRAVFDYTENSLVINIAKE